MLIFEANESSPRIELGRIIVVSPVTSVNPTEEAVPVEPYVATLVDDRRDVVEFLRDLEPLGRGSVLGVLVT